MAENCCCHEENRENPGACLICGKELVYLNHMEKQTCSICGKEYPSNARCVDGHFVCDECHAKKGLELVVEKCKSIGSTDPLKIADALFSSPEIHMHGPEHHVLAGAATLTAYCNRIARNNNERMILLQRALKEMLARGKQIPGGVCGFWGCCGAAASNGAAYSIITGTTPMSKDKWGDVALLVSRILARLAELGGPRCCKRTSFLAITETAKFLNDKRSAGIRINENHRCGFSNRNKECLKEGCPYYPQEKKRAENE